MSCVTIYKTDVISMVSSFCEGITWLFFELFSEDVIYLLSYKLLPMVSGEFLCNFKSQLISQSFSASLLGVSRYTKRIWELMKLEIADDSFVLFWSG